MAQEQRYKTVAISEAAAEKAKAEKERLRKDGVSMSLGAIISKAIVDNL